MKQIFTTDETKYIQQNTHSTVPYEDEGYEGYDGYTVTPGAKVTGTITPLHVKTMDELVHEMVVVSPLHTIKLCTQPDPRDLETFWCFSNWSAAPIEQLYVIAGEFMGEEEPQAPYDYLCCMSRELFEWVSPCFPKPFSHDGSGQNEILRKLRLVQITYNRTKKIDTLLTSAVEEPEPRQSRAN